MGRKPKLDAVDTATLAAELSKRKSSLVAERASLTERLEQVNADLQAMGVDYVAKPSKGKRGRPKGSVVKRKPSSGRGPGRPSKLQGDISIVLGNAKKPMTSNEIKEGIGYTGANLAQTLTTMTKRGQITRTGKARHYEYTVAAEAKPSEAKPEEPKAEKPKAEKPKVSKPKTEKPAESSE